MFDLSEDSRFHSSDVVIINGIIVKNRQGKSGGKIGHSLYVWDEKVDKS